MKRRTSLHQLDDMIAAGERALRHFSGVSLETLLADEMRSDAVVRALEVVGEACKRLDATVKDRFSTVPWKSIAGMRDRLIHRYDNVDWPLVYDTLTQFLPQTVIELREIRTILEAEEPPRTEESRCLI